MAKNKQPARQGGMLRPTVVKKLDSQANGKSGTSAEVKTTPVPRTTGGHRNTMH